MTFRLEGAPPTVRPVLDRVLAIAAGDPRVVGVIAAGSAAAGTMDEFSDLDLVIVCTDEHHGEMLRGAAGFAGQLGTVVAAFTGEHVGEPRLLITLIGSPPLHVDLKFVTAGALDSRVEDGLVLWQRDGVLDTALARNEARWPMPDPQWIEDRFWVWTHYGATKIGRGELFEALSTLGELRGIVLGPLIARQRGHRPAGVRRLETIAPDLVPALQATVGAYDQTSCLRALRACVDVYRSVRDETEVQLGRAAEATAMSYLDWIEQRLRPG